MATLNDAGESRGQLLLSAAFVLAVLFVILALALNTSISAANQGSQGSDPSDTTHLMQLRADTIDGTAGLIARVNHVNQSSYDDLAGNLSEGVDTYAGLLGRHEARTVGTAAFSLTDIHNGSQIRQLDADRPLTNVSGAGNWTLVDGVPAVRGLELSIQNDSLVETDDDTATELRDSGAFHVELIEADSDRWRVFLYTPDDAGGAGNVSVAVESPSGSLTGSCERVAAINETVTVDADAATLGGQHCAPLTTLPDDDVIETVHYRNGSNAKGTYRLVVDSLRSNVDDADLGLEGSSTEPYATAAIYEVTGSLEYVAVDITYRTTVTVSPGDSDV